MVFGFLCFCFLFALGMGLKFKKVGKELLRNQFKLGLVCASALDAFTCVL